MFILMAARICNVFGTGVWRPFSLVKVRLNRETKWAQGCQHWTRGISCSRRWCCDAEQLRHKWQHGKWYCLSFSHVHENLISTTLSLFVGWNSLSNVVPPFYITSYVPMEWSKQWTSCVRSRPYAFIKMHFRFRYPSILLCYAFASKCLSLNQVTRF